jgi:hypothetical protein
MLPKARRRVYGRVKKAYRRFHHETDFARACRIWDRLKRQATEIAAGI